MKEITKTSNIIALSGLALVGLTAGAAFSVSRYIRNEIRRRGYPAWDNCLCDFKTHQTIYQVWHSTNERRGETIISHEWGIYLTHPAPWQRRFLHHGAQILAVLNPLGRYVQHVTIPPQQAQQYSAMLRSNGAESENELTQATQSSSTAAPSPTSYITWRSEVLRFPRYLFDACIRRLYPAHIAPERLSQVRPLDAIWDPHSNLLLPIAGSLLDTPEQARIDCIGWAPSQVSYCTTRIYTS